jgi:multicomponent Na+:H+ antiporter subunit D
MGDLALRLTPLMELRSVQAGCAFIIVGLGLKLALFPLHFWLPNAYTYAPSAVSTFMAACATKVAFYAFLRFLFVIFGASEIFEELRLHSLLMPLAMLAILAASTVAVMQANLKRMLAYSSVAQIGYILLGVSLGSASGLTAGFLHILNHGLMKGTLFMALGCVVYRQGHARLESLYGMGRQMPFTMAAFVIGGLSLIGVPLTAGFISKWYLLTAALSADAWPGVIALVLGSLLAIAYIWRAVEAAYFTAPPPQQNDTQNGAQTAHTPLLLLVPLWILVLANIYFGVDARGPVMLAERAAQHVLGR